MMNPKFWEQVGRAIVGDLREANLEGADLRGANLGEANLRWANLGEANLREAKNHIAMSRSLHGYSPYATKSAAGDWIIVAGCHQFTIPQAREYWGSSYYHTREIGDLYLLDIDRVEKIIAMQEAEQEAGHNELEEIEAEIGGYVECSDYPEVFFRGTWKFMYSGGPDPVNDLHCAFDVIGSKEQLEAARKVRDFKEQEEAGK